MYRFFANNLLLHPTNTSNSSKIEWAYSFDVHTNGYFPIILLLYLTQIFLWPLLIRHEWICLFFGNTLYLVAVGTVIIKNWKIFTYNTFKVPSLPSYSLPWLCSFAIRNQIGINIMLRTRNINIIYHISYRIKYT